MALKRKITKDEHAKLAKELQSQYKADGDDFILETEGDEDNSGLKTALQKERDNVKEYKKQLKELNEKFGDLDPEAYKELMARFENDDEAKLIKAGKIDEVIAKRTEKLTKEYDKKLAAEAKKTAEAIERSKKHQQRVVDNEVRAAASKMGLHEKAVDDALFRARTMFSLNDEGLVIQLDKDGHPIMGKDGKTLYAPTEWLEGMRESAPHWFPAGNSGSGAEGNNGGNRNTGKRVVKRADYDKMPIHEQATVGRDKNVAIVD